MFRAAPVVEGFVLEAWNDAYTLFRSSRASHSNRSSTVSPGAYFRYHQHHPSLTNM